MKKMQELFATANRKVTTAVVVGIAACPMLASAADGDIDTTKPLLYIAGGVAAAILVGGAMYGLVTLIGVGKKAQRAGT